MQGFHHLVHGADQHVRSLEDLLDAELLPVLVELRCRFTPVLRHDHPLDLRAQLETTESLAGRFPYHPQALVDARDLPSRHVGRRAASRERDAREIHGIGLARRQREEAKAIASDDDRRMRPLDGKRMDRVAGDAVVLAGEVDLGPAEQALDDRNRLGEPLDPDASSIEAEPDLIVLDSHVTRAQPQLEPSIRQEVHRRRLSREQHGMAEIVVDHVRADPESCRRVRGAHHRRDCRQHGGEVVGHQEHGVAQRFDLARFVLPLGSRLRVSDIDSESERLHRLITPELHEVSRVSKTLTPVAIMYWILQCITAPPSTLHAWPVM